MSTLSDVLQFVGLLGGDPAEMQAAKDRREAEMQLAKSLSSPKYFAETIRQGLLSPEVPMPPERPQSLLELDKPTVYNNPGNVERNQGWAGMVPDTGYGSEDRFAVFDSPQMGLRALMRDTATKIKKHGGNLSKMINEYAPPSENPTKRYYEYVKSKVGRDKVTVNDLPRIVQGIIEFENKPDSELSKMYLDPKVFEEALSLSKYNLPAGMTLSEARSFAAKKKK
jgi:hypothetical protein